jgi:O-antigen ligase
VVGLVAGIFVALPSRVRLPLLAVLSFTALLALVVHDPRPGAGLLLPLAERFAAAPLSNLRLEAWHEALDAAHDRPLLGYGQDHFKLIDYTAHPDREELFDRAHNLALDWLISGGLLGMLAWFWLLWATREAIKESYAGSQRACLYGFLVAYVGADMFLFDTMGSYLPLVAVMAISKPTPEPARRRSPTL